MDKLIQKIIQLKNPTVVGLDPKLDYVPSQIKDWSFKKYGCNLKGAAKAFLKFNKGLIDGIYDIVPAVKPQSAYYEALGHHGVKVLQQTIDYAQKKGMYVITDAKRNDIGSTMEAYADAYLGITNINESKFAPFGSDALTVNGYLGTDGIAPLTKLCKQFDKDIFVLVKTSNPSSGELQDRLIDGQPVYAVMGQFCEQWGEDIRGQFGYSAVGAVVGATYPEQLTELRRTMPHTFFLMPGYGAQGGSAKDVMGAFDKDGLGGIINSSRAIITAWKQERYGETEYITAARDEALKMRDQLRG